MGAVDEGVVDVDGVGEDEAAVAAVGESADDAEGVCAGLAGFVGCECH